MEQRLKDALSFANHRLTLANQIEIAKDKLHTRLSYSFGGGTFQITNDLLGLVNSLKSRINANVLLDDNERPIRIPSMSEFHDKIFDIYIHATEEYHEAYSDIIKNRSVSKIVGYDD